jgi:hypothetical protein
MAQPKSLAECTVQEVASAVRDILGWSEALTLSFEALCVSGKRIGRMEEESLTILCQSRCPEHVAAVGCLMAFRAAGCLSPPAPALDNVPAAAGGSALNPSSSTCVPSSSANVAHEISPPIPENTVSLIEELQSMGFHPAACSRALQLTNNSLSRSVDWLLSNPDEVASAASGTPFSAGIMAMCFDLPLVRQALEQTGGDEQRAITLILNGEVVQEGASRESSPPPLLPLPPHPPGPNPHATAALPPCWQQMTDIASGRIYYRNPVTGETQRERPVMPSATHVG